MSVSRVAVLIDQANLEGSFRSIRQSLGMQSGVRLDYRKLVRLVTMGSNVVHRSVYLAEQNDPGFQRFVGFFKAADFRVVSKPLKVISTGNGDSRNKANFDVEIAVDACRLAWEGACEELVLISGDSDFAYLIDALKRSSVRVSVVSSQFSVSSELRSRAERVVMLEDILHLVTFVKRAAEPQIL